MASAVALAARDIGLDARLTREIDRFREELESRRLAGEVREVHDEAVKVLQATRKGAGATGSTSMATHFGELAIKESRTANLLRWLCALTLLSIGVVASLLLVVRDGGDLSTGREIAQLAVTIPLGLMAAYLGREASGHRATARWAKQLEVQLLTLDAFAEPLSAESSDLLRTELGRQALLSGPVVAATPESSSAVDEAVQLIDRVSGMIRRPDR